MSKTKFRGFMAIFYISHRILWVIDLQACREIEVTFFWHLEMYNYYPMKSWYFQAVLTQV